MFSLMGYFNVHNVSSRNDSISIDHEFDQAFQGCIVTLSLRLHKAASLDDQDSLLFSSSSSSAFRGVPSETPPLMKTQRDSDNPSIVCRWTRCSYEYCHHKWQHSYSRTASSAPKHGGIMTLELFGRARLARSALMACAGGLLVRDPTVGLAVGQTLSPDEEEQRNGYYN